MKTENHAEQKKRREHKSKADKLVRVFFSVNEANF